MSAFFSPPKAQPLPAAPAVTDPAIQQAAQNEATYAATAAGRGSTILTSGMGVSGGGAAATGRKILLGGS